MRQVLGLIHWIVSPENAERFPQNAHFPSVEECFQFYDNGAFCTKVIGSPDVLLVCLFNCGNQNPCVGARPQRFEEFWDDLMRNRPPCEKPWIFTHPGEDYGVPTDDFDEQHPVFLS